MKLLIKKYKRKEYTFVCTRETYYQSQLPTTKVVGLKKS